MKNTKFIKEQWRQGQVLNTRLTSTWTENVMREMMEEEVIQVFSNFHNVDEGKSRKRVCVCTNKEDANFIACAPDMFNTLQSIVEDLSLTISYKKPTITIAFMQTLIDRAEVIIKRATPLC